MKLVSDRRRWVIVFWLLRVVKKLAPEGPQARLLRKELDLWASTCVGLQGVGHRRARRRVLRKATRKRMEYVSKEVKS